ncbi:MAG: M20/M25/M40 family metallo-hydrolase [Pseudomonadales bacterium]|jgi:acetylornithine deacetylase/succinyl-diaminopimelate desuccinylase-like protein|nr:M20/M25/M40 family metallo-hydrolase [Pseudomonadales bacterium]
MDAYVRERWEQEIVPLLCDYVRIPAKSPAFDAAWAEHGHLDAAAELLATWARERPVAGLAVELVRLPGRTPLLLCEIPATRPGLGTVLLYGHYDKQPEFAGWREGLAPWEPVLEDGRLYGRGGADDGYALFGCLTAIEALQQEGRDHGRCVVLIEGCEESGSFDLPPYLDHLAERIGTPELVVCLDAECGNYDQLWLTTSLRGMLPGVLTVEVLTEGVHSGLAGNIVPSSFRHLRGLVERVEDALTGELRDVLQVQIPQWARDQAAAAAAVLGDGVLERFPWVAGPPEGLTPLDALVANTWQPSMATVGLSGAPEVGDAGNVLRPETRAKLVFRLPPSLDAVEAAAQVKALLEADPPPGARVRFDVEHPQTGWSAPPLAPWLEAAVQAASRRWFGPPAMAMGCGGTIPFMKMLGDRFPDVQFLVTGVLGPHSNAHGPNEFLHLETARRLTGCVADVLEAHATRAV